MVVLISKINELKSSLYASSNDRRIHNLSEIAIVAYELNAIGKNTNLNNDRIKVLNVGLLCHSEAGRDC